MGRQAIIPVVESSQIGEARRTAVRFAEIAGLGVTEQGKIAIVATEMATNLVRHAVDGQLLVQIMPTESGNCVEMLSIDSGPGIANVEHCLQDGFSTGGTAGNGMGAIKRLSHEFDIHSTLSHGTVVVSRVGADGIPSPSAMSFLVGAASIPVSGETACGDSWKSSQSQHELRLMVTDGLGHGPLAEEAANAAEKAFDNEPAADPKSLLEAAHRSLSGTRGAAIAVAHLHAKDHRLKYAGVGNISGSMLTTTGSQGLVSHNGIVGIKVQKLQQFEHTHIGRGLLIMHSDGLKSRWTLNDHPGLSERHPALIAAVLFRDCRRGRDDATVVVVRFGVSKG